MPIEVRRGSIEMRRRPGAALLGVAVVLALAGAPPARAQGEGPAKAERTWTDPPARGGGGVTAAPDTPKSVEPPSVPRPVVSVAPHPVRPAAKVRIAARSHTRVAAPQVAEPQRRARTVAVVRPPAAIRRPGIRMVTLRPAPPYDAAAPGHVRYGYTGGIRPVGRVDDAFETDRDRRIRQARAAGYVVVRARTLAFPDGRRLRSYQPYDPDDFDD